jgi:hypothetical protein
MIATERAARIENRDLLFNVKHSSTAVALLPLRAAPNPRTGGVA